MSALVFAGSSQFIAVDLWREPVPILLLTAMALLVNARHVLMGAALAPRLAGVDGRWLWPAVFFLADEVWALTLASERRGTAALAFFAGIGVVLYLNWVFWTCLGAVIGAVVTDPARYGLDFAFIAVFMVLLRSMWRGRVHLLPWLASALVAALVHRLVPGPWYVPAGALAGLGAAAWATARRA